MKKFYFLDETLFLHYSRPSKRPNKPSHLFISLFSACLLLFPFIGLNSSSAIAAGNSSDIGFYSNQAESEFAELNVSVWVYLEGALANPKGEQSYTSLMRSDLNGLRMLPGQTYARLNGQVVFSPAGQPYNQAPWFYNGNEGEAYNSNGNPIPGTANYPASVVDWILVSLRSAPDGMSIGKKAALLHNDGHVEFVDGGFQIDKAELQNSYYIVIEHRNHLIIMTPEAVPVVNYGLSYDFRYSQSYTYSPYGIWGSGQKELLPDLPGVYAMYTGNVDQVQTPSSIKDINFTDRMFWEQSNMYAGHYCPGDFNLNGDCNFNDRILFEINNGKYSSVP
jgi:hypothetical protein